MQVVYSSLRQEACLRSLGGEGGGAGGGRRSHEMCNAD